MFLNRNKKNNVYPCKPQFYHIKVGYKGVIIIQVCFRDDKGLWIMYILAGQEHTKSDSYFDSQAGRTMTY